MLQRPKGEFQAGLQIEEGNGAVLKFGADDPLRTPPQTIPIKRHGAFEIIDPEREDRDGWIHAFYPGQALRGQTAIGSPCGVTRAGP